MCIHIYPHIYIHIHIYMFIRISATHCNIVQRTAVKCTSAMDFFWQNCNALQHTATHRITLQQNVPAPWDILTHMDTATHCNKMYQCHETSWQTYPKLNVLQHAATQCNTLQHTAILCTSAMKHLDKRIQIWTYYNTLQHMLHTAILCTSALKHLDKRIQNWTYYNTLQHNATHCNTCYTLQYYVPAPWNILTNVSKTERTTTRCNTLQHAATHCTTMYQRHETSWQTYPKMNVLQHAATHCNTCYTLQYYVPAPWNILTNVRSICLSPSLSSTLSL